MSDIVFNPFSHQAKVLRSQKRIKGIFCGKRCINPLSKVLTQDGVKSFGDISDKDNVLSFDQKAKRFRFSQSGSAFPKTKETGYRVIHDRGEFVASGKHRVLCYPNEYLSVEDIFSRLHEDNVSQEISFVSHSRSIEELDQLSFLSDVASLRSKVLNFLYHYGTYIRQYGQRLHSVLGSALNEFPSLSDARILRMSFACPEPLLHMGDYDHRILKYNRHDPSFFQTSTPDDSDLLDILTFFGFVRQADERDRVQPHHSFQEFYQQPSKSYASYKDLVSETMSHQKICKVDPCKSNILAIERVSTEQWFWDLEVPGDNNYISEGAIHHNSGKTEVGAIDVIQKIEQKPNWNPNGIDPFLTLIIAPTHDMMRTLSLKKFLAYSKPFIKKHNESRSELQWHDHDSVPGGNEIIGMSADNPQRIEGKKANLIWLDEVLQMSEQTFLECRARIADSKGYLICTGSLGTQYVNPKTHWAYKYFKQSPDENTECFEWSTKDNPYFPADELQSLSNNLDPKTFRQMFEIDWDTTPLNAVYADFDAGNVTRGYVYNDKLETFVSIDWGFAHPMACLYFQYDRERDTVYLFDEIVMSGLTLEKLWSIMRSKPYRISGYCCDIAGNQEREQSAISNVRWFREKAQIQFKFGSFPILPGIALVRSYIKNGLGQSKFVVDEVRCPKSLDSIKQYKYPVKNGIISNENPEKLLDDPCDSLRYFFMNFIKPRRKLNFEIG